MIKDYVVEIIDSNNVLLNLTVLTDVYDLSLEEFFELIPEHLRNNNIQIVRESDADLDGDAYVDCSTYFMKINGHYIKNDKLAKEIFSDLRDLVEYKQKYESY